MSIRALAGALVLSLAVGSGLPVAAEAGHRHSRHCGHRYGYYDTYYGDRYGYGSYGYGHGYGYRYDRYYVPSRPYYVPGYLYYNRGGRCYRPHLSISFGW